MKTIAVIPAYNEETRIGNVVRDALQYVSRVIVVDDGSTDHTSEAASDAGAFVVRHPENAGAGAATMTGIIAARQMSPDALITLDADGQHDPKDIPTVLAPLENASADAVFTNRFGLGNSIPLIRRIYNSIGNFITFLATGRWVLDSQSGFKAFSQKALAQVDLRMSGFEFCSEIVREAVQHRWRVQHVPIKVVYSEYTLAKGQSFASGIKTALKILLRSLIR